MNQALVFQDVTFNVVDRSGEPWLRLPQLGVAFGYQQGHKLLKVYDRHKEEFTSLMTAVVELDTAGGRQPVRIFSLRGAHLLGMFARTDRAKEFRRWVLNVLEQYQKTGPHFLPAPLPQIDKDTELAIKQRCRVLADSWYAAYCLQLRHQIKSGQFSAAHISAWMPGGQTSGLSLKGEPRSRWFCWYNDQGDAQVRQLADDERMMKGTDIWTMVDSLKLFCKKYEAPLDWPAKKAA